VNTDQNKVVIVRFFQRLYLDFCATPGLTENNNMKLLRIKAVTKKELLQIWRDPLSLAMAFMMPVMLLFIFGYAITLDVNNLETIVYDLDKSSASRELVEAFSSSGYFTVVGNVNQQKEIDQYLDTGKAFVVISIPKDFSEKMKTGRDTSLQVIVDGSDSNTATIALGYISAITERYSLRNRGGSITPLIDPRVRVWYNPELKSRNFIIPGLIAIIMAVITALLTSLTIAREWERGTMEQLIATPIKTPELILGKLIPYFFIGFIDVVFSVLLAVFLFEVPLRGSPLLLMLLSSIFLFGGLSLGILISTVAKSQLVSSQISMIATFLPAFLLSGFMFSISNMPKPLQFLTLLFPARYFVTIVKGIFLKGSTLSLLAFETILLVIFGLFVFAVANRKFKKRII